MTQDTHAGPPVPEAAPLGSGPPDLRPAGPASELSVWTPFAVDHLGRVLLSPESVHAIAEIVVADLIQYLPKRDV